MRGKEGTRLFSNTELKHLKWSMITQRKMTPKQANDEIARMIKETKKNHALAKSSAKHKKQESRGIIAPLLVNSSNKAGDNS